MYKTSAVLVMHDLIFFPRGLGIYRYMGVCVCVCVFLTIRKKKNLEFVSFSPCAFKTQRCLKSKVVIMALLGYYNLSPLFLGSKIKCINNSSVKQCNSKTMSKDLFFCLCGTTPGLENTI